MEILTLFQRLRIERFAQNGCAITTFHVPPHSLAGAKAYNFKEGFVGNYGVYL
jgi:hypothetical protein|tara:strand:+ start:725 stop:883 length:159 start_codon:yes stop_codon:yes gene_type:complete